MITVFGSTGRIGGAAAVELRRRGLEVRAVVRDLARGETLARSGCQLAAADLRKRSDVERALDNASGALVICPLSPTVPDVEAAAERVIDALSGAIETVRPARVVVISDYGADQPAGTGITMIFHRLETSLRAAPTSITFVRSAEHMQNWKRYASAARARGVLPSLHPLTKKFPTVSAPDVGVVAADLLSGPGGTPRVLHVEGPRRYTVLEVAKVLERIVGRPVEARELPRADWMDALLAAGLSESYARLVAELQDAHNIGRIDAEAGGEIRRGPTELADALTR